MDIEYKKSSGCCSRCSAKHKCYCNEIDTVRVGEPTCCRSCGGTWFCIKIRGYGEYGVSEYEVFCMWCDESVAYWAHGYYDPAYWDDNFEYPDEP